MNLLRPLLLAASVGAIILFGWLTFGAVENFIHATTLVDDIKWVLITLILLGADFYVVFFGIFGTLIALVN